MRLFVLALALLAGCADPAPEVSSSYDYSPALGGLSRIQGTATNGTSEARPVVVTVGCDGEEVRAIRLPPVAPGATVSFSEAALCASPDASIIRAEFGGS